jgi:NAD(P)-dependent dehydrogenase (short-subunit alcohol dehydrogenase family)
MKQRMTDRKGKTALVPGSTSGIGQATAIALAARGAHVLVVGRNEQRAKDVVAEIEGSGGNATFRLTNAGKTAKDHEPRSSPTVTGRSSMATPWAPQG